MQLTIARAQATWNAADLLYGCKRYEGRGGHDTQSGDRARRGQCHRSGAAGLGTKQHRGGALLGGGLGAIIGGAATGSAGGAVAGALIGGATGALIGSEADRRRSYYWWRGGCYQAVQGGYVRIANRYCY